MTEPVPGPAAWHELSRRTVYHGFKRSIEAVTFRLPSGTVADFDVRREPDSVAVLALDTARRVLLTEQFRPGIGQAIFEMPGGYIEKDECPQSAASRELAEETGYTGEVRIVGQCYADSYCSARKFAAVATSCAPTVPPHPDPEEDIRVETVGLARFRQILRSGQLADTDLAYLALDALGLV